MTTNGVHDPAALLLGSRTAGASWDISTTVMSTSEEAVGGESAKKRTNGGAKGTWCVSRPEVEKQWETGRQEKQTAVAVPILPASVAPLDWASTPLRKSCKNMGIEFSGLSGRTPTHVYCTHQRSSASYHVLRVPHTNTYAYSHAHEQTFSHPITLTLASNHIQSHSRSHTHN